MLKSQTGWNDNGNGEDAYGFSALPAGSRDVYGNYDYAGEYADIWSAAQYNIDNEGNFGKSLALNNAYGVYLSEGEDANVYFYDKDLGFSVRCLKD